MAERLSIIMVDGIFAICRMPCESPIPSWAIKGDFFSITRTADELSIVSLQIHVPEGARCEKDWRCLRVVGTIPFSAVGVLASLVTPLADAKISVFAASTFDTDYLFIQDMDMNRAVASLEQAGFTIAR